MVLFRLRGNLIKHQLTDLYRIRDAMLSVKEHATGADYDKVRKALSRILNELAGEEEGRLEQVTLALNSV